MTTLSEERISCPYCGESITVLIDDTDSNEEYIEDCQVCCRPITFNVTTHMNGELYISVRSENEV